MYIHKQEVAVAKKYSGARKTPRRVSETKTPMSYRLSPGKIARAQAILGTPTATATIEEALDLVIFRSELMDGINQAFGLPIRDAFPDNASGK
jgi:hypothetical protein